MSTHQHEHSASASRPVRDKDGLRRREDARLRELLKRDQRTPARAHRQAFPLLGALAK